MDKRCLIANMVLAKIKTYSDKVRSGFIALHSAKNIALIVIASIITSLAILTLIFLSSLITKIISLGIGASSLSTLFIDPLRSVDLSLVFMSTSIDTRLRFLVLALVFTSISVVLLRIAPECRGPGGDRAIDIFRHRLNTRIREPLLKLLTSSLTFGSGLSVGLTGPALQIGASIGSLISRKNGEKIARATIIAGLAAATATLFGSIIASPIFAIEIVRRRGLEIEYLLSAILGSCIGYTVRSSIVYTLYGHEHPLTAIAILITPLSIASVPSIAVLSIVIGIVCGVLAALFSMLFISFNNYTNTICKSRSFECVLIPFIAVCIALTTIVFVPLAGGTGFESIKSLVLASHYSKSIAASLAFIALIVLALRIVDTSITIGTGVSGGVVGPSMVMGMLIGIVCASIAKLIAVGLDVDLGTAMCIAMAAFVGAVIKTPISFPLIVCEITGKGVLYPFALAASILATHICGKTTLYRSLRY